MQLRAVVLTCCLLITAWYLAHAQTVEAVPAHSKIESMPLAFDGWAGRNSSPFSPQILAILGVDSYVTRTYWHQGGPVVGLYVGSYESQRQGDTMHSPLNCMPGAGWLPTSKSLLTITAFDGARKARREIVVNRVVVERGLDRQLVLYWYQSHGRVVASEYLGEDLHRRRCIALQPDRRRARASHDAARRPAGSRRAGLRGSCRAIRAGAVSAARPIPA